MPGAKPNSRNSAANGLDGQSRGCAVPKLSQELGDQGFASMVKRVSPRIGIIEVSVHKELLQMFWEMLLRVEQLSDNQLTFDLQALCVSCMQCLLSLGDAQPTVLDTTIHGEYQRKHIKSQGITHLTQCLD